jgi:hypothetical protein
LNLYLKTRLYEEPFIVHKALTVPNRIDQWVKQQTQLTYSEQYGFGFTEDINMSLKADHAGGDKTIPFTLTITTVVNTVQKTKKAHFELFYMRSHSQSLKFTDIHFMITDLDETEVEKSRLFLTAFLETLRIHYNGKWIITDQELFSARLF